MKESKVTVRLESLAEIYDVPIFTLRKWASERRFPGIIKRRGERRLYVDLSKFDLWFKDDLNGHSSNA